MDCPHPSTVSFKVESQDMVRFTWVKNCCAESIEGLERTKDWGCDPCTHIFSCALCHESSFHHIFILTEKNGFVPESNNCIGR